MIDINNKYEIGEEIRYDNKHLKIIGRFLKEIKDKKKKEIYHRTYYKIKCMICGHEYDVRQTYIQRGCPKCNKLNRNKTIPEREPWMVKYFIGGEEEAKQYFPTSTKKIDMKCPDCGNIITKQISVLYHCHSLGCPCGDSVSVPEKYVYALLQSLNISFMWQATNTNLKWIENNIRYDFYLPDYNCIIETHGGQHYVRQRRQCSRTLEEEQENDIKKKNMALRNGIKNYVVINCYNSHAYKMEENIIESNLLNIIGVNVFDINWKYCLERSTVNLIKEICEYYNLHQELTLSEIGNVFSFGRQAISHFLNQGNVLGWCNYNSEESRNKSNRERGLQRSKPIEVSKNGTVLGLFFNVNSLVKYSKEYLPKILPRTCVIRSCEKGGRIYQGYNFKYITQEEYNNREENKGCLNLNLV